MHPPTLEKEQERGTKLGRKFKRKKKKKKKRKKKKKKKKKNMIFKKDSKKKNKKKVSLEHEGKNFRESRGSKIDDAVKRWKKKTQIEKSLGDPFGPRED